IERPSGVHTGYLLTPAGVRRVRVPRRRSYIQMSLPRADSIVTARRLPSREKRGCAYDARISARSLTRPSRSAETSARAGGVSGRGTYTSVPLADTANVAV